MIVNLHWGGEIVPEYQTEPSSGQLELVKRLTASRLITAIVGQGPHAVQPIQRVNGKFVVFSEGNLISNQSPMAGLPGVQPGRLIALLDCVANSGEARVAGSATCRCSSITPTTGCCRSATPKGAQGDPTLLRDSYERTVSMVGRGKGIEPCRGGCRRAR